MQDNVRTMAQADVLEKIQGARYSCRAYKPEPVPHATIERILQMAQNTASWCNSQPWQVVITEGAGTEAFRDALYKLVSSSGEEHMDITPPREYSGVYLDRRRESGFQLYNALGIPKGDKAAYGAQAMQNFKLFGAPHVAIITSAEALGPYGAVDCGAYVANFMLAATSLGVGTIAQAALARRSDFVREHFKIGDDRRVVCGISFGFPDEGHVINNYRTNRASVAEAVTFVTK